MNELIEEVGGQKAESTEQKIFGVTLAQVVNNIDSTLQGRVQIKLPWLPGIEPWARVATLATGEGSGTYFMPQIEDEVLVAFNHGDVRDPFIIGCPWNNSERPPINAQTDAVNKRIIRTPSGHRIEFEEVKQSITVTTASQHSITMKPSTIEIATAGATAKVVLKKDGAITIEAKTTLDLKAPTIRIQGDVLKMEGTASATLDGGTACTIKGTLVNIN